ncbi:hypothetical protein AGMMS50248_08350 [Deltaproteobacteria bacterium]|nr:hypothetical protein AGMMS49925_08340 [Deltaproteobacteria bacterium]GHU99762.1 hypothetical protein AGMMS50248_08350 [Deltaproteobacteria bacterium]
MVAEEHNFVCLHIVVSVREFDGGRLPRVPYVQDFVGNKESIKTVSYGKHA